MNDDLRDRLEAPGDRGEPRGADPVLGEARAAVRRRRRQTRVGAAAVALLALIAGVVGIVAVTRDDDGDTTAIHTDPEPPPSTVDGGAEPGALPAEIDGVPTPPPDPRPITIWMSERVIPTEGADVVLALWSTAQSQAVFGVQVEVDRWDGESWTTVRRGATCVDHWRCAGAISLEGPPTAWEDIGLSTPVGGGVGPAEWLHVDGLEPGWYRLRKTSNERFVATGHFAVVDEPVELIDVGDRTAERLSVHPVVLVRGDRTLAVEGHDATYRIQRWADGAWHDTGTVTEQPDGGPMTVPELDPGPYRLVGEESGLAGVIWASATTDPNRDADGRIVLDEARLVVEGLPADYRMLVEPESHPTVDGARHRSTWTFGSASATALTTVSVERGPGAAATLDRYRAIDGVERQGAPVHVDDSTPLAPPIGWSPAPDVVIWLGTNGLSVEELLEIGEGVRLVG